MISRGNRNKSSSSVGRSSNHRMRFRFDQVAIIISFISSWSLLTSSHSVSAAAANTNKHNDNSLKMELHNLVMNAKEILAQQQEPNERDDDNNEIINDDTNDNNDQIDIMIDQIWSITTTAKEMTTQYQEMIDYYREQYNLLNVVNSIQLNQLIVTLQDLSHKYNEMEETNRKVKKKDDTSDTDVSDNNSDNSNYVTMHRLNELLSPDDILSSYEQNLYEHIRAIVDDTKHRTRMEQQVQGQLQKSSSLSTTKSIRRKSILNMQRNNKNNTSCVNAYETAQTIQDAIHTYKNDYIGLIDVLQNDATMIVHEMTSPTYHAASSSSSDIKINSSESATLGSVWWNKYMPEDWEKYLLPYGWETMNDPTISMIQLLHHWSRTLGFSDIAPATVPAATPSRTSSNFGLLNAIPETILYTDTSPGSCWPMIGTNGYVTIRLPYTIQNIHSISIDHVSNLNLINSKETIQSAPKNMYLYVYSPCSNSNENNNCNGLGFDISTKRLLLTNNEQLPITYDINHTPGSIHSVQTFPIIGQGKIATIAINSISGDEFATADDDDGTCSPTKPTCGGRDVAESTKIAAIQLEILDNWGNEDYTCLYRVRVHGDN